MSVYIIGIDPGQSGGIVALNNGSVVDISPMAAGPKAVAEHFRYLGFPGVIYNSDITAIFIENVHSMPTDGVHSAFVFGQGLGWLEGVMAAMGLPEALKVNSSVWMGYFDLKRDKEQEEAKYDFKKRLKEKALQLVEKNHKDDITLKTCDAYLIARYGNEYIQNGIKAKGIQDGVATTVEKETKQRRVRKVVVS